MAEITDQKHRVVDQFSQQAAGYSRLTSGLASGDRQAAFRRLAGLRPDDLMLDACCGNGVLTLDCAPHVARAIGLDLTPAMLEQAGMAQAAKGIGNVDWMVGDVSALPFDDNAFSLITCSSAFHHLSDPVVALGEMVRVCRSGGRVVVRDVTPAPAKSAAYDRMEILRDPSHVHALTPDELRNLGRGLPVDDPVLYSSIAADLSLDAVLATSFPQECSLQDIRGMFLADALSGEDQLGFSATLVEGEIKVSYAMTTAIWHKR
jgi:ubiquinone/menaquinone biosynthesis C-methylase UbiE